MSSVESIAKSGEKNLLRAMFADSDEDSVISLYSDQDEECNKKSKDMNDSMEINALQTLSANRNHLDNARSTETESVVNYISPISNITITLHQNIRNGIAHQLWPAASFLCDYFDRNSDTILSSCGLDLSLPVSIIELGAGIGLCGIFLSKLLYFNLEKVLITDLPEAMLLMERNIHENILPTSSDSIQSRSMVSVQAKVLHWGNHTDSSNILSSCYDIPGSSTNSELVKNPPLIIAADCIYWESLFQPFLDTILTFTKIGCHILVSNVRRWKKDNKFFKMCEKNGLQVNVIYEVVDRVVNENTNNESSRRVTRIYRIFA